MKNLLPPTLSVILSTALSSAGCRALGMPSHDVLVAAIVAGSIAATVAFGTILLANPPRKPSAGRRITPFL